MKLVQMLIAVLFSAIFFLVGVYVQASFFVSLNVTVFCLFFFLSFLVPVSNLHSRAESAAFSASRSDFVLVAGMLGALTVATFFVMYGKNGVPILSDQVEIDRMVLVNEYGVFYRIVTQAIFFLPPIMLLARERGFFSKRASGFFILLFFFLLLSMGFRSRLVDYVAVIFLSLVMLDERFRQRLVYALLRKLPKVFLGSIVAVGLIAFLTYLREEEVSGVSDAVYSVFYRAFLLNYDVNFNRVFIYVDQNGLFFGETFFKDFLSFFLEEYKSMQVVVTEYFNKTNSDLFIMTPTIYGEFYLNFSWVGFVFVLPIILLYRFMYEHALGVLRRIYGAEVLFFAVYVNYIYYIPRQMVTGGVSNAFLVRGLSILIVAFIFLLPMVAIKSVVRRRM